MARLIAVLLFVAVCASAQEEKVYMTGVVNSITSLQPLSYVNISLAGRVIASTDQNGFFSLSAMRGDTIVFTRLGFKPNIVVLTDNSWDERIFMSEMTRVLDEVTIYDKYKFQGLDEMEKSLDEDARLKNFENFTMSPEHQRGMVQTFGPSATVSAPWGKWNKEAREQKKLQAVVSENQRTAVYADFIHSMAVEQFFRETFKLDSLTYLKGKEGFIIANPDARYLTRRQDIVDLMIAYFATRKP